MKNVETEIMEVLGTWKQVKRLCMTTIGKDAGDGEPSSEWKKRIILCQHSPIRKIRIAWKWNSIPYCISSHFVRHHVGGVEKWVQTQRNDRTGVDRANIGQMEPVKMEMEANIQSLLDISRKRLCMCADATTYKYWNSLKNEIAKIEPEIAWAMSPECIRCGGCPEYETCHMYEIIFKNVPLEIQQNIAKRYDYYNEYIAKNS